MAYPRRRSSHSGPGAGRTLTYPGTANLPRIDARAVTRDIDGNVTSEPGERAFTGIHRGMDGTPLSGKSILTGATVNFPQRSGVDASAMTTGNRKVAFDDAQTRSDALANASDRRGQAVADAAKAVTAARTAAAGDNAGGNGAVQRVSQDAQGRTTGFIADRGNGARDLTSIYGKGQASPPSTASGFPQRNATPETSSPAAGVPSLDRHQDRTGGQGAGGHLGDLALNTTGGIPGLPAPSSSGFPKPSIATPAAPATSLTPAAAPTPKTEPDLGAGAPVIHRGLDPNVPRSPVAGAVTGWLASNSPRQDSPPTPSAIPGGGIPGLRATGFPQRQPSAGAPTTDAPAAPSSAAPAAPLPRKPRNSNDNNDDND